MPEAPHPPDPPMEVKEGQSLLGTISREMVKAMKTYYGLGPTQAKAYFVDDLLFIVMRGGITPGEQTLIDAGETDTVRAFRQRFANVMAARLSGTVEQLVECKVRNYQSQVLVDPDLILLIFVLDQSAPIRVLEETAQLLVEGDGHLGPDGVAASKNAPG
jgi:uncharacterized protein YbcI